MTNVAPIFHRPELAKRLAGQILVASVGRAAGSGIFLAAPRRTGKSTFVREDLRPVLEADGALVVYADLWADPGLVISNAIRASLAGHEGVVMRLPVRVRPGCDDGSATVCRYGAPPGRGTERGATRGDS